MDDEFDAQVVGAAFQLAGVVGWGPMTLVDAAREAGLDLARMRGRFPGKMAVLLRFGSLADQAVLAVAPSTGGARDKLFDVVMARFDYLQQHRAGVLAVMESLRVHPGRALLLWGATLRSMRWLLEVSGISAEGAVGALRVQGMGAVWAYTLRAWSTDDSADLSSTMAALDRALDRAIQAEGMLPGGGGAAPETGDDAGGDAAGPTPPKLLPGAAIAAAEDGPAVL